jgi:hypothetical protein
MTKINIVSTKVIEEHYNHFTQFEIQKLLMNATLKEQWIRTGIFECYMNLYAIISYR